MERIVEYNLVDRSGWYEGVWENEPDRVVWLDPDTGYPCLILRNPLGALCGYVGVPVGHPCYGFSCTDVESKYNIDVHGGLTFDGRVFGMPESPLFRLGTNLWFGQWFGFDCSHYMDYLPNFQMGFYPRDTERKNTYRELAYVEKECRLLAKQFKALAEGQTSDV